MVYPRVGIGEVEGPADVHRMDIRMQPLCQACYLDVAV